MTLKASLAGIPGPALLAIALAVLLASMLPIVVFQKDESSVPTPSRSSVQYARWLMKLIVHIGTHKTGTTALQQFLHANRAPLAARGFHYATPPMGSALQPHR